MSRRDTAVWQLTTHGIGQSTCVGIGGDAEEQMAAYSPAEMAEALLKVWQP